MVLFPTWKTRKEKVDKSSPKKSELPGKTEKGKKPTDHQMPNKYPEKTE